MQACESDGNNGRYAKLWPVTRGECGHIGMINRDSVMPSLECQPWNGVECFFGIRHETVKGRPVPVGRRLRHTLSALLRGLSEKEAAKEMGLSAHTVHSYVKQLYAAYGVRSRAELMASWISPEDIPHLQSSCPETDSVDDLNARVSNDRYRLVSYARG